MKSTEYGTIATYNGSYCFIRPDSGDRDLFCHASELPEGRIHRGDRVRFDVAPDPYKPGRVLARNVRFVESPAAQETEEERSQVELEYDREEGRTALADALRRASAEKENHAN